MKLRKDNKKVSQHKALKSILVATIAFTPLIGQAMPEYAHAKGNAKSSEVNQAKLNHEVPILSVENINTSLTRPDQAFDLVIDEKDNEFKKVRQQLENQSFGLLFVDENGAKLFVDAKTSDTAYVNGVVHVKNHPLFKRYTAYKMIVLVKSDYQQAKKGNSPEIKTTNYVAFKTGSDLHEPTTIKVPDAKSKTSVLDETKMTIEVTDDYGLSGHGVVEIETAEEGSRLLNSLTVSDETFVVDEGNNGKKTIALSNKEAEVASLDIQISSKYGTKSLKKTLEFEPGYTEDIQLKDIEEYVVGKSYKVTGTAKDRYGNFVKDGVEVKGVSNRGAMTEGSTANGEFELSYQVSTKKGMDSIEVVSNDSKETIKKEIYNRADHPAKVVLKTTEVKEGEDAPVVFEIFDQYDNAVEDGEELEVSFKDNVLPSKKLKTKDGKISFEITPDFAGNLEYSIEANSNKFKYEPSNPIKVIKKKGTLDFETINTVGDAFINLRTVNEVETIGNEMFLTNYFDPYHIYVYDIDTGLQKRVLSYTTSQYARQGSSTYHRFFALGTDGENLLIPTASNKFDIVNKYGKVIGRKTLDRHLNYTSSTNVGDLAVKDGYLYTHPIYGKSVSIFDYETGKFIKEVGGFDSITTVQVYGDKLIVGERFLKKITILDISNPLNAVVEDTYKFDDKYDFNDIEINGDYLYRTTYFSGKVLRYSLK